MSPQADSAHIKKTISKARKALDSGKLDKAEKSIKKSLKLSPQNAECYNILGQTLKAQGKLTNARDIFVKGIQYKIDHIEMQFSLGTVYEYLRAPEQALQCFKVALALAPNSHKVWAKIGTNLEQTGQSNKALGAFAKALTLLPQDHDYKVNFARTIRHCAIQDSGDQYKDCVLTCLKSNRIDPDSFRHIWISSLKRSITYKTIQRLIKQPDYESFCQILDGLNSYNFLNDEYICLGLEKFITTDILIERTWTNLRRWLLERQKETSLLKNLLPFISSLACQCHLTEYIYNETTEERDLALSLQGTLEEQEAPPDHLFALLGCYTPLYKLKNASKISKTHNSTLTELQITQPLLEEALKSKMPTLGLSKNNVSQKVRAQYEENPYPRWFDITLNTHINKIITAPHQADLKILVAGCGTGQHPLLVKSLHPHAHITAIDFSKSSLAYAQRKTEEMGICDIAYKHADILELSSWEERFDLIESAGVLHHMKDPMQGWRVLRSLLKPQGKMAIGLYSDIGRQHIIQTKEYIAHQGYPHTYEGIRQCRTDLKQAAHNDPLHKLLKSPDFYTMSGCRDLIFHEQEHRFTINQISKMLEDLKLEFIGFNITNHKTINLFQAMFPDDTKMTHLNNWHEFEQKHPETFKKMYQMSCRAID